MGLKVKGPSAGKTSRAATIMAATRERAFAWRRRAATIGVAVLALFMGYGVIFGHNGLTVFEHKRAEARTLQAQMEQLQEENQRLREHDAELQNDPSAIEHEAREELHYTRPGEVIYTLPPAPAQASPAPAQ